ncbi:MAG: response regulator transcription factor [Bacilli bacterium]
MKQILIVEDDNTIRSGLKYCLECENFKILEACNGNECLDNLNNNLNLILLDVNLPDIAGFTLFKKIKEFKNIPIIFLTANDLETSIVMGLDMGADDYVTKPFKARELVSRIKNVLRRNDNNYLDIINIYDITIDLKQAKVFKNKKDIYLTALEYKILLILALSPNTTFTREQILANIWDVKEEYVYDNTLTVYIKRIREKVEDDVSNPKIIKTIRGIGYKIGGLNE